jgi:hypothetical protein
MTFRLRKAPEERQCLTMRTTGIGSLPFDEPERALAHAFARYGLPFLPQLPRRTKGSSAEVPPMLAEVLTPRMRSATARHDRHALIEAVRDATIAPGTAERQWLAHPCGRGFLAQAGEHDELKAQLIGPLAATLLLETLVGRDDGEDALFPLLVGWITQLTLALTRLVTHGRAATLVMLWDDGALPLCADEARRQSYVEVFRSLQAQGVALGVHCCEAIDAAALIETLPGAVLALDTCVVRLDEPAARVAARRHLSRGGRFIFGVFDTRPGRFNRAEGLERTRALASMLDAAFPDGSWRGQVALSGGCGTGLRSEAFELELAAALSEAAVL